MNTFKSIDELLRVLEREKLLLKQMFQKRASTSLKSLIPQHYYKIFFLST